MHGLVHLALRSFVLEEFGEEPWAQALEAAGVTDEEAIMKTEQYPDSATVAVISETAKALGLDLGVALTAFGEYFVGWLGEMEQLKMVDAMGDTLEDLLRNLNCLHHALSRTHRDAQFPTFAIEGSVSAGNLVISYASLRGELLAPLVEGVMKGISVLKVGAPLIMTRIEAHKGFNCTWACHLGAPVPAVGADSAKQRERTAQERRAASQWHLALMGCCGGQQSARVAVEPAEARPHTTSTPAGGGAGASGEASAGGGRSSWWPFGGRGGSSKRAAANGEAEQGAGAVDEELLVHLDKLLAALPTLPDPGGALMRTVTCGKVAASFDDAAELKRTSAFWRSTAGSLGDFALSEPAEFAARFVSHTWEAPADWHDLMGPNCQFAEVKAAVLCTAARDLAATRQRQIDRMQSIPAPQTAAGAAVTGAQDATGAALQFGGGGPSSAAEEARLRQQAKRIDKWQDATLWVDKCCLAQQHPILPSSLCLLEQFVRRCEGLIALFTWDFFERLWCVYEWALFLVLHDSAHVQLCVDFFLSEKTLPHYIATIRAFSLRNARTHFEGDVELIQARVEAMFQSIGHFERFVQLAAIVHISVAVAKRTGLTHTPDSAESELTVWAALAAELGFSQLADALQRAKPASWLRNAEPTGINIAPSAGAAGDKTWRAHLATRVDSWYRRELKPLIEASRARSIRLKYFSSKSSSSASSEEWLRNATRIYAQRVASGALLGAPSAVVERNRRASAELAAAVDEGLKQSKRGSREAAGVPHAGRQPRRGSDKAAAGGEARPRGGHISSLAGHGSVSTAVKGAGNNGRLSHASSGGRRSGHGGVVNFDEPDPESTLEGRARQQRFAKQQLRASRAGGPGGARVSSNLPHRNSGASTASSPLSASARVSTVSPA